MRRWVSGISILAVLVAAGATAQPAPPPVAPPMIGVVPRPAAIVVDGVPPINLRLLVDSRPYLEARAAAFAGWNPRTRGMLITTRFGDTSQLHEVAMPGGARTQISFEGEPVNGSYAPSGDVLLAVKDNGGDEFFQLHRLSQGRLTLLTDGRARNTGPTWSKDGRVVGYTSTRRNGTDGDLWAVDPRDPKTDRLVAQVKGGGWGFADLNRDGTKGLVGHYLSIEQSELFEIDMATGALTRITKAGEKASYQAAQYGSDGTIYVTTDRGSDFQRLGVLARDGGFRPLSTAPAKWDVDDFDIADDGSFIAATLNEAGSSTLQLIDPRTGRVTRTAELPAGVIGGLEIAPWGAVGFTLTSAKSPADAHSLDPATGVVTRWTRSETGGLDATVNVEPELVTVKSFDGLRVQGFLYIPDRAKFPGKRPLIVNIHGGPEGQTRPGFQGRNNYLLNELGVAIFYPNVRGSTGYGKKFVGLDNGPFLRENSVRDIGAFLDHLDRDDRLDRTRFGVTGGSYGGYMNYAAALRYGDRFRAAYGIVGISNFVSFLQNTQSYRRDLRRAEYGDERDPKQRAKLLEISPLRRASEIKIPMLVATGANDPRVPQSEADQLVAAIRAAGGEASHVVARNEGHGFAKKENADYIFWAGVAFWQRHLLK